MVKSNISTTSEFETGTISDSNPNQSSVIKGNDAPPDGQPLPKGPGLVRRIWDRWMKIAEVVGTTQMVIILSIIYRLVLPLLAVPFRMFSDPLKTRRRPHSNWHQKRREVSINSLDSMGNQY